MKQLFAVLMALGLVGFMACSSPSAENEATEESSAVMDEMENNVDSNDDTMAEEGTAEEGTAEEGEAEEAAEVEEAPEAE